MATLARMHVELAARTDEFQKAMDGAAARMQAVGAKMTAVGKSLTARVSLPLAAIGAASFKMASDAEESANKFDVVMGDAADSVRERLQDLTETIPMTRSQMEKLSAGIQDMLVPMGVARDRAAGMSADMVQLAGDLSSFNNVPTTQVLEAMQSALAGSSEPMRRFGVDTRVARLEQIALEEGIIQAGQAMDNTTTALAVLAAIQRDSTDAMGDAARTVDSTANSMKFLWRDIQQVGITIGEELLPVITPWINRLRDLIGVFSGLNPEMKTAIIVVGGIATALGPLTLALGALLAAIGPVTAAVGTMMAAIGGITVAAPVAALAALGAALVVAYKKSETFREIVDKAFAAMAKAVGAGVDLAMDVLGELAEHFTDIAEEIIETLEKTLIEPFMRLWDIFGKDIIRVVRTQWEAVRMVFGTAWEAIKALVTTALQVTVTILRSGLEIISNAIQLALNLIQGDWSEAWDNVVAIVRAMKDAVIGVIKAMWDGIMGFVNAGIERVTGAFQRMKDIVVGNSIVPDMVDLIGGEFERMAGTMTSGAETAKDGVAGEFGELRELVEDKIGDLDSFVGGVFGRVQDAISVSGLKKKLEDWVGFFIGFANTLKSIWDDIKDIVKGIADFFRGINQFNSSGGGLNPLDGIPGDSGGPPDIPGGGFPDGTGGGSWGSAVQAITAHIAVTMKSNELLKEIRDHVLHLPALIEIRDFQARVASNTDGIWTVAVRIAKATEAMVAAIGAEAAAMVAPVGISQSPAFGGSGMALAGAGGPPVIQVHNAFYGDISGLSPEELSSRITPRIVEDVDHALGGRRVSDDRARGTLRSVEDRT